MPATWCRPERGARPGDPSSIFRGKPVEGAARLLTREEATRDTKAAPMWMVHGAGSSAASSSKSALALAPVMSEAGQIAGVRGPNDNPPIISIIGRISLPTSLNDTGVSAPINVTGDMLVYGGVYTQPRQFINFSQLSVLDMGGMERVIGLAPGATFYLMDLNLTGLPLAQLPGTAGTAGAQQQQQGAPAWHKSALPMWCFEMKRWVLFEFIELGAAAGGQSYDFISSLSGVSRLGAYQSTHTTPTPL